MSTLTKPPIAEEIVYPESDGKPMADNTKQYEWIVTIKENLDAMLPHAFVAADLFWYPVQGNSKIVQAPDVMVAVGRPKGHRRSYKQWEEGNTAPQAVFEILSPGNRDVEMLRKLDFYERYGAEEYYVYDPDEEEMIGYTRKEGKLKAIGELKGWVSPLLGIRFESKAEGLEIYFPDGNRFPTFQELRAESERLRQSAEQERRRVDEAEQRAQQERQRADETEQLAQQERQRAVGAEQRADEAEQRANEAEQLAQQERQRTQRLEEKLRELGIDPRSIHL